MDDKNLIGKAEKPVAELARYERGREERRPGALKGKIKIAKDFDELPEDIAQSFGMENRARRVMFPANSR